jgi:hypothetical protein
VAADFVSLYSEYLESPREFFYFSFLFAIGTPLAGKLTLRSELRPETRYYPD